MVVLLLQSDFFQREFIFKVINEHINAERIVIERSFSLAYVAHRNTTFDLIVASDECCTDLLESIGEELPVDVPKIFTHGKLIIITRNSNDVMLPKLFSLRPVAVLAATDVVNFFSGQLCTDQERVLYVSSEISSLVCRMPDGQNCLRQLTKTEKQVAILILYGKTSKEISSAIHLSIHTVNDHRKSIRDKMSIRGGKDALILTLRPYLFWLIQENKTFKKDKK